LALVLPALVTVKAKVVLVEDDDACAVRWLSCSNALADQVSSCPDGATGLKAVDEADSTGHRLAHAV
jgi:hypothetical protein